MAADAHQSIQRTLIELLERRGVSGFEIHAEQVGRDGEKFAWLRLTTERGAVTMYLPTELASLHGSDSTSTRRINNALSGLVRLMVER